MDYMTLAQNNKATAERFMDLAIAILTGGDEVTERATDNARECMAISLTKNRRAIHCTSQV